MNNIKLKKQIMENIDFIKNNLINTNEPTIIKKINDLTTDIENDFYTIVVLGEFKRGKSTFVNSLIEKNILPANVLPTTATINALMFDPDENTYVVKYNGQAETGKSSLDFLSQYVAGESIDVSTIKYLKIGYPADILKNNVVIVDTPGVSDINEQRVQVTYDFIPKANAVIFLLDATSPLKRSEKEFIDEHLVKLGIDRILFIANKFDDVDEEEEQDVLGALQKRLISTFRKQDENMTIKDITVLPMSSTWALKGIEDHDEVLIEQSGITAVRTKISNIIAEGNVAGEKIKRYKIRVNDILNAIQRDIDNQINLYQTNIDDLKKVLTNMDEMLNEKEKRKTVVRDYIENEKENIIAMTKKSLVYFHNNLKEEIDHSIEGYTGENFKEYVEKNITTIIKKNMERWSSTYFLYIDKLIEQLEREVARGLAMYFRKRIILNNYSSDINTTDDKERYLIDVEAEDVSTATVHAGVLSAGAAGIMMLIGMPAFIPFISMAAFPFLRKGLLANKLREAKLAIMPEVDYQLVKCMNNLESAVIDKINERIEKIQQDSEKIYDQLFMSIRKQVEEEISHKETAESDMYQSLHGLKEKLSKINNIKESLQLV